MPNELFIRQQRWLVNATFLCNLVAKNNQISGSETVGLIEKICDEAIANQIRSCQEFIRPSAEIDEDELQDFIKEARGGKVVLGSSSTDPIAQNWKPIDTYLNKQVLFDMECVSPSAQELTKILNNNLDQGVQVNQANKDLTSQDVTKSLWFKMCKLSYLNRKVCLMAENVYKDTQTLNDTELNKGLFVLYENAQRIRCSTFSSPYSTKLSQQYRGKTFGELKKKYKELSMVPTTPFSKERHRLRENRLNVFEDTHPETKTLAINAGAALFKFKRESTLGTIEHVLGLPERSDISGTNTDAIGYAITFATQGSDNLVKQKSRAMYVLVCMTTMSLFGHHSLSETATAASLWSESNYQPFLPQSVLDILTNLYDGNGMAVSLSGSGCSNVLVVDPDELEWTKNKWQSLKLDRQTPNDLAFNDGLWWTTKAIMKEFSD